MLRDAQGSSRAREHVNMEGREREALLEQTKALLIQRSVSNITREKVPRCLQSGGEGRVGGG